MMINSAMRLDRLPLAKLMNWNDIKGSRDIRQCRNGLVRVRLFGRVNTLQSRTAVTGQIQFIKSVHQLLSWKGVLPHSR